MKLLDEGGLRALTLRSVAQQVGVAPASLYSRVESVDDLFDLALDTALADDPVMSESIRSADLPDLMHAFFAHLTTHRWAGQVIGMRAPRGPAYLALSERMCVLLEQAGTPDPLGTAYRLSNLVIGASLTAPMASDEKRVAIDPDQAPTYARLHATHHISPREILSDGITALLS
ncbi:TetR/AcrR family transcriptional regulator [Corynebacterium fournieri]|uniref:TetR/AcrR family transcriptional regulator n=1 Tax=Corynebacterium fournieri TaxID=1852390 RepID=UPI000A2EFF88|nr:TetR family transcriptional regulator [Corynebacterium fournieri]WJY98208.1 Transcriptional regulator, TetR family [Corynebacterium fournieri]